MTLVVCVQIPDIALAIVRRDSPALRDIPLILYTAARSRAIVYAADHHTNLPTGIPLRHALLQCPQAVCRTADPRGDQAVFTTLVSCLQTFSPRVAPGALLPDATVELDLGRVRRHDAMARAQQLAQTVRTTLGLIPAMGLARTRFVARVAAQLAGAGIAVLVPPGTEASFLAPLPITLLPVAPAIHERLYHFGLHTMGAVAALPIDALLAQFGPCGRNLHQLTHGRDEAGIPTVLPEPTIERRRRFDGPVVDRRILEQAMRALGATVASALEQGGWAARDLVLTLVPPDDVAWTQRRVLRQATSDPAILTQTLLALLGGMVCTSGIEQLSVQVTSVQPTVATQAELFASHGGQTDRLRAVIGRLAVRYTGAFVQAQIPSPHAAIPEQRIAFVPREPQ